VQSAAGPPPAPALELDLRAWRVGWSRCASERPAPGFLRFAVEPRPPPRAASPACLLLPRPPCLSGRLGVAGHPAAARGPRAADGVTPAGESHVEA